MICRTLASTTALVVARMVEEEGRWESRLIVFVGRNLDY